MKFCQGIIEAFIPKNNIHMYSKYVCIYILESQGSLGSCILHSLKGEGSGWRIPPGTEICSEAWN